MNNKNDVFSDKNDFTRGSIFAKLIKFMLPILSALILQAMYGAVDLLIVGQYGSAIDVSAVSTGSQISAITQKPRENTDIRPFFGGRYLSVYAALCGGRAYRMLYDLVKGILADFGCDADEEAIYTYLNRAAEKNSKLKVTPTFAGRFDDPEAKGSIEGITTENFTLPALANGFLKGMIRELYEAYLAAGGEDGVIPVVSGNAMRKNPTLRKLTHRIFGMETLMPRHREEASFGAALYGGISAGLLSEQDRKNAIGYTCG